MTTAGLSPLPWNRNNREGFLISTLGPLAAVLIANALYYATGFTNADPAYDRIAFSPPGWFVGLLWCVIYPMWGASRWYARQTGLAGRRNARWVAALMAWGLLYPLLTAPTGVTVSALANAASLVLALAAAYYVRQVSKRAFWLIAPSIVWLGFATLLGFAALAHA